jgi:hypothetical protein
MGLGITLLSMDEMGEFGRITDEEHGCVVEHLECIYEPFTRIYNSNTEEPTQSRLPSSVLILMAKPLGSRAVSALPLSPPTVEKRTVDRALLPIFEKIWAQERCEISCVTSKYP